MKAHSLTISIPKDKTKPICDKNCAYCISRMTGYIYHDYDMVSRNIPKARTIAKAAGVSSVLITSKGEPLLHFDGIARVCEHFKDFPLELQTNGLYLSKNLGTVKDLKTLGIDVIAISIDTLEQLAEMAEVLSMVWEMNLTNRICLNLTDMIPNEHSFSEVFKIIKEYDLNQLLIRNITIPDKVEKSKVATDTIAWIHGHTSPRRYYQWQGEFNAIVRSRSDAGYSGGLIRVLPHGAKVYDLGGIAVSFSDYCVQEYNNTEDIRSLIFLEDGHMYPSWDKQSSRLF